MTNFGLQLGEGNKKGGAVNQAQPNPRLTVNGEDNLTINIRPNQLERWRLVNAGTNHRAFSQKAFS